MANRCLGYIFITIGSLLMILSAICLITAVDMYIRDDISVSKTPSRFTAKDKETYLYTELVFIGSVLGAASVGVGCCGVYNLRNARVAVIDRTRRRYLRERPRRLIEGARAMRPVYRRSPPPEELEMHM